MDGIEVTATRSDEEPSRLIRLHRVLGYVYARAECDRNFKVLDNVRRVHDHKGVLTVTWGREPTEVEEDYFLYAWMSSIGDGCDNVEHEVIGEPKKSWWELRVERGRRKIDTYTAWVIHRSLCDRPLICEISRLDPRWHRFVLDLLAQPAKDRTEFLRRTFRVADDYDDIVAVLASQDPDQVL